MGRLMIFEVTLGDVGLDVELIRIGPAGADSQRRPEVQLAVVADTRFRFAEAVERALQRGSTSILDRIDLYGVLEVSCDEVPRFLTELDRMLVVADEAEREVLEAVRGLAERCRDDRSALRFIGD